jgi:hypothetical protein
MTKYDLFNLPRSIRWLSEPKWSTPQDRQDQGNWHKKRAKALVESALPERQT